jgi:hypothetical protein
VSAAVTHRRERESEHQQKYSPRAKEQQSRSKYRETAAYGQHFLMIHDSLSPYDILITF